MQEKVAVLDSYFKTRLTLAASWEAVGICVIIWETPLVEAFTESRESAILISK